MKTFLIIASLLMSTPIGYDNTYVIDCNGYNTFINHPMTEGVAQCYLI
jgi:hypothetical protein